MNVTDLRAALATASKDCAPDSDIRASVTTGIVARAATRSRRRNHTALAVAAAVVLIAGSITLVTSHIPGSTPSINPATARPAGGGHGVAAAPDQAARLRESLPATQGGEQPVAAAAGAAPSSERLSHTLTAHVPGIVAVVASRLVFPVDVAHLPAGWAVLARWESADLIAVDFVGSGKYAGLQGQVQYAPPGQVPAAPARATVLTVDGHHAKAWHQSKTDDQIKASGDPADYQVFASWTDPAGGQVKLAADSLDKLQILAPLVDSSLHPITPLLTATATIAGYVHFTAFATAMNAGGSPWAQLCAATHDPSKIDGATCIGIETARQGTTIAKLLVEPADQLNNGRRYPFSAYRATTINQRKVYVAPDSKSVLTADDTGTPLVVTAPTSGSTMSTAALAAVAQGAHT